MKRYTTPIVGTINCEPIKGSMDEDKNGDYVLYSDVIREMIPRPDADEARKAVALLLSAKNDEWSHLASIDMINGDTRDNEKRAQLAQITKERTEELLRLMGVENA